MRYKYKKGQIFGKRLDVPKDVLERVYRNICTYNDFVKYGLFDKIPSSCMRRPDIDILTKFGNEKCDVLDWELISKAFGGVDVSDILMSLDPETKDLNLAIYEQIKDKINPSYYSSRMREFYSDRFIDPTDEQMERYGTIIDDFNKGRASLSMIVKYWNLFKDKDLSYCLLHDDNNGNHITNDMVRDFMANYGGLVPLISKYSDIYTIISDISVFKTPEEKRFYLEQFTDGLLSNTRRNNGDSRSTIELTEDEYREIFKYSSMEDYLKTIDSYGAGLLIKELKGLPEDYIFNTSIPFLELLDYDVLHFVGTFGIKNIAEFDDECGQFFTRDDCRMLKLMYDMYMHYGGNVHNPNLSFFYNRENKPIKAGSCSKDDFYDAMRKMIVFGPTDGTFKNNAPDYRTITGEFRTRNSDLFISKNAPEELQKLFYSKSITPKLLREHPDYIEYLRKKDFACCFKDRYAYVEYEDEGISSYENFYSYISWISNDEEMMNFILEYGDVLDIVYDHNRHSYSGMDLKLPFKGSLDDVKDKINIELRKIIIQDRVPYPANVPDSLYKLHPEMFLDKDAPKELQDAFYSRSLTAEDILMNPSYREYLNGIDLEVLFKYMPISMIGPDYDETRSYHLSYEYININLVKAIEKTFGEETLDIMILYGKYFEKGYEIDQLRDFIYDSTLSKKELLNKMDSSIYQYIIDGKMKYDENISSHFKDNYPTLFLDSSVSKDIRKRFYNREFTLQDFYDNPELLDTFGNTNIAGGLSKELAWIIPLFDNLEDKKLSNTNRLKVLEAYENIQNERLRKSFIKYVKQYGEKINLEKIDNISEVFSRLEYSNSIELSSFSEQLAIQLLDSDDPLGKLKKIEKVFLENNSPLCGKMFLCFQILYPSMSEHRNFNFSSDSRVAPGLKDESLPKVGFHASNDEKRLIVIFNDLLRVAYRSNERSFEEYLTNLEEGNRIYYYLQNNGFDISTLNDKERETLTTFVSHLEVLYNNVKKNENKDIDLSELPLVDKLKIIGESFHETSRYELKDRIVRAFCYSAGIKSFDELKQLSSEAKREQRERIDRNLLEMEQNDGVFKIQEGDFVRGIGYYDTLGSSLNAGNYCKEQLGVFNGTSTHDTTPLDVDLTLVTKTNSLYEAISGTPTGFGFGNVYVIMRKNNPNISISRDKDGELTGSIYDPRKLELFGTRVGGAGYETHWGARTGFSLADVDFILYKEKREIDGQKPYDEDGKVNYKGEKDPNEYDDLQAIKFEIAKNGYYIPVIDFSGKLIFTKEEFKEIRDKMDGLSYFGESSFTLSESLVTPEVEEIARELTKEAEEDTNEKRQIINGIIKEVLDEMGISIKYKSDGDLSSKSAEFIDTGSTGRGTNIPYDGDFDFFMRLDAEIIKDPQRMSTFKRKIIDKIQEHNPDSYTETDSGDLRFKKVNIDNGKVVDLDISFGVKTSKVQYSSDECLRDRLSTIKELYPDQYNNVVANIILAKRILKDPEVNAYKPRRSDRQQGGMGGVGIENWILQNGGSFVQACQSFLDAAVDENGEIVPFEEFRSNYQLWDFGENHFSARKGHYLHDNFIECNMTEGGYKKMIGAFQGYLKSLDRSYTDTRDAMKK